MFSMRIWLAYTEKARGGCYEDRSCGVGRLPATTPVITMRSIVLPGGRCRASQTDSSTRRAPSGCGVKSSTRS